jgi:hypothetical protein
MSADLYIATPCAGGLLHHGYVTSLLSLGAAPFKSEVRFRYGDSLITRARNILVSEFMAHGASHMLFIDADISFTVDHIIAMLEWSKAHPGDVVAGRYRFKQAKIDWVGVLAQLPSRERFQRALYAGTGFMLIPRAAIDRLIDAYPTLKYTVIHGPDTTDGHAFFNSGIDPETREFFSEDFSFCRLCRNAGINIWLDTQGKLVHTGSANYE